jgi:hypothetical protein
VPISGKPEIPPLPRQPGFRVRAKEGARSGMTMPD